MSELPKKRGRRKNKNAWMNDLSDEEKIHIDFDAENRPIGNKRTKLAEYIGLLARDGHRFPITKQKWKQIDSEQKEKAIKEIKLYFDIDVSDKFLSNELSIKWKDHKCSTKRKFYTDIEDKSECDKNIPKGIVASQWVTMVQLWNENDDIRKLAEQNARNRAALTLHHRLGSKSLAQVSHEFRQENNKQPTRMELFQKSYTSTTEGVVNPHAAERLKDMEKLKEIMSQNADGELEDLPGPNDIFAQVMGPEPRGRIRLMPHVKPKDLFPRQSSTTNKKVEQDLSDIKKTNAELQEKNVELQEKNIELERKLSNVTSEVSSLKAQMTEFMNLMRSSGAGSSSQLEQGQ